MSRHWIIVLTLVAAAPAPAQDRAAIQAACRTDFMKLCPGLRPEDGRLAACFKEKQTEFSQGCRAALKDVPQFQAKN